MKIILISLNNSTFYYTKSDLTIYIRKYSYTESHNEFICGFVGTVRTNNSYYSTYILNKKVLPINIVLNLLATTLSSELFLNKEIIISIK